MQNFKRTFQVSKRDRNEHGQTDQTVQKERFIAFQSDCMFEKGIYTTQLQPAFEFTYEDKRLREYCGKFPKENETVTMELSMWCDATGLHVKCFFMYGSNIISSFSCSHELKDYCRGHKIAIPQGIIDQIGPEE